jgi:hypothetical protein
MAAVRIFAASHKNSGSKCPFRPARVASNLRADLTDAKQPCVRGTLPSGFSQGCIIAQIPAIQTNETTGLLTRLTLARGFLCELVNFILPLPR